MSKFKFTEEQEMFRKVAREFGEKEIIPRIKEMEENKEIPNEIIKSMADLGLLAMCVPEEYGGISLDAVMAGVIGEELARADTSCAIAVLFLVEASWGYFFSKYATKKAKEEILPKVIQGKSFLGIATTEPDIGSDLALMRTKITKSKSGFVVSGEKRFISGIREAQKYGGGHVTLAKQVPDNGTRNMTLFYLPIDAKGMVPRLEQDMGRECISCGGFSIDNVRIPKKYIIGQEGKGFYAVHEGYEFARGIIALVCCGSALKSLENAEAYAEQRKIFGGKLIDLIKKDLAEYRAKIEEARVIGYQALKLLDEEQKSKIKFPRSSSSKVTVATAAAKAICFKRAMKAIDAAMQWQGAFGYTVECQEQRAWRGVRSFGWAEGAFEIMELIVERGVEKGVIDKKSPYYTNLYS